MFGRTFSFWRRLAGKTDDASVATERRLWVRYPAAARTNVQSAEDPVPQNRVSAKVRDISVGGANLLVDQRFDVGQMVSVELPRGQDAAPATVLACVVRAEPQTDGEWALGCVFSRELTDEDFAGFGAQRDEPVSDKPLSDEAVSDEPMPDEHMPKDQRAWARFRADLRARFQKISDLDNRTYLARVLNLSASGVGLEVTTRTDAGALLSVDFIGVDGSVARTILSCVVHVTARSSGVWALGCNFIRELSEEDLSLFV
jgi:hypothetical protein